MFCESLYGLCYPQGERNADCLAQKCQYHACGACGDRSARECRHTGPAFLHHRAKGLQVGRIASAFMAACIASSARCSQHPPTSARTAHQPHAQQQQQLGAKNRVVVWQDIRYHYDSLGRVTRKISGQRQDLRIVWNAESQISCTISTRKGQPAPPVTTTMH